MAWLMLPLVKNLYVKKVPPQVPTNGSAEPAGPGGGGHAREGPRREQRHLGAGDDAGGPRTEGPESARPGT